MPRTAMQMVLLAPSGTVPMIRLQGRSLGVMVDDTPAIELARLPPGTWLNLPLGSGSVSHGREVFDQQCAACHGAKGEGGLGDRLVGGQGTLATPKPVRTVGSY